MALNPNIPLSGQQPNPLGAIYESEGIKGRRTQRAVQEQALDQQAREMEIGSLLDTSVRVKAGLDNNDIEGTKNFLRSNIQKFGPERSRNSQAVLQAIERGDIEAAKKDAESAIQFGIQTGRLKQMTSGAESMIGKLNPDMYTPESVAAFEASGNRSDLKRRMDGQFVDIGGVPHFYDKNSNTLIKASTEDGVTFTPESIAESEGVIAEGKEFGKLTGKARAEAIDSGIEQITKSEANIQNLEEAWKALDEGAESGAVISKWTPTLRSETQKLEQARAKLGLDVVGAVTFGALSKGELDIALQTALPNLPPKELKQWIRERQEAQRKLIDYYDEQIDFLDSGGTVAGFRRMKRAERRRQNNPESQNNQPAQTENTGNLGDGFSVEIIE